MTPQSENENQYEDYEAINRKKAAFLLAGVLVILAAVILAFWLFSDKTNASTGEGESIRITPDRIEQISNDVSEQVLDTLRTDILSDMIGDAVTKELTKDKIYEIAADHGIEVIAIGDEDLRAVLADIIEQMDISGDGVLTKQQKEYIRRAVRQALQEALAQMDISN